MFLMTIKVYKSARHFITPPFAKNDVIITKYSVAITMVTGFLPSILRHMELITQNRDKALAAQALAAQAQGSISNDCWPSIFTL